MAAGGAKIKLPHSAFEKHGKIPPAREVHHIKPLAQGGANDDANLMALCTSCHSELTAREGGRWQRK